MGMATTTKKENPVTRYNPTPSASTLYSAAKIRALIAEQNAAK